MRFYRIILLLLLFTTTYTLSEDCKLPARSRPEWFKSDTGVSVSDGFAVNSAFISAEVFPNPGQNLFQIRLTLKKDITARITINDINGKLVKELANSYILNREAIFNWKLDNEKGEKVSNGVYFLNIDAKQTHLSKKLIVE